MSSYAMNPVTWKRAKVIGPQQGFIVATPDWAQSVLDHRNNNNRNMSERHINRLARDMSNGTFVYNGDNIRFAADGTLLDGQHRLAAIVKSGISLDLGIVWNLPNSTQDTMDDGRKRTMANVLELSGEGYKAKTTASILRRAVMLERGNLHNNNFAPTKREMQAYLEAHPEVKDSAAMAEHVRNGHGVRCAASTLGLAHYMFSQKSRKDANLFFQLLRTGAGLDAGDPILVLRNRLSVEGSTRLSGEQREVLAWFIKAWNAWRQGKKIKILRHKSGEAFPEAI